MTDPMRSTQHCRERSEGGASFMSSFLWLIVLDKAPPLFLEIDCGFRHSLPQKQSK